MQEATGHIIVIETLQPQVVTTLPGSDRNQETIGCV